MQDPIIIKHTYNAPVDKVWSAISNHAEMIVWYFPNLPAFEANVGFKTNFTVEHEGRTFLHYWEVIDVVPLQFLSYKWTFKGYTGSSISEFVLIPDDQTTHLTLTATTIENFPEDIPEFRRESSVAGWTHLLKTNLKEYLEK